MISCTRLAWSFLGTLIASSFWIGCAVANDSVSGKAIYDYYCYQCHGYAGNARTLAATFIQPLPRDFTAVAKETLDRARMMRSIANGREGTAMTAFASVLTIDEISAVTDYIRNTFMGPDEADYRYHTTTNGWPDHERYEVAFPFADGTLALNTAWEALNDEQRAGKRLFISACISCHDRARVTDEGPAWTKHALSYPRKHYSHRLGPDHITGPSPYALHDVPLPTTGLSDTAKHGAKLFNDNCAFCHGADGTGKNWIGSFMTPHPRNLANRWTLDTPAERLGQIVLTGRQGTSMPAWEGVLSSQQVSAIVAYLKEALARQSEKHTQPQQQAGNAKPVTLNWQRRGALGGS